ncbi:DUF4129 domain-containing protein [Deinococcus taeanensis]|uniref:DUF4129 domain-containing protein n=1 Tax=Deinococcus taeanensis TaxID=2737050 RepID=UPI001CDB6DD3|nr:DUF4129 domain-containing protein [Deinococcus taeanensis]UBV41598.1 DUF4129 domain-containing protein [Deinococcus taeanensis]
MTEPPSALPDALAPPRSAPQQGADGLALLPLSLAGLLPAWAVGLLCLLFALSVRSTAWAQGRLLITQLLVGGAVIAQAVATDGDLPALLTLAAQYLLLSVAALTVCWSAQLLEDGRRRGLLLTLALGLLAPQPGLLLALAGGALGRRQPGLTGRAPITSRRWWPLLGGALVILTLSAALLPAAGPLPRSPRAVSPAAQAPAPPAANLPQEQPSAGGPGTAGQVNTQIDLGSPPPALLNLAFLLGVACLGCGAALLLPLRGRSAAGRVRPRLPEVLMIGGLLLTGLLWLAAGLLLSLDGQPGAGPHAEAGPAGPASQLGQGNVVAERVLNASALGPLFVALGVLTLILLLAALLWVLNRRAAGESHASVPAPVEPLAGPAAAPPPLHRVRAAYREALSSLTAAGLGRAAHETPTGFAARLGAAHPELAGALLILTQSYEPVRYGGRVTDEDAGRAETAARSIQAALAPLTPHSTPPPVKDPP